MDNKQWNMSNMVNFNKLSFRKLLNLDESTEERSKADFNFPCIILMYHRIFQSELDSWSLCVSPKNFAKHLQLIQEIGYPISLEEFVKKRKEGNILKNLIIVTFDDGYADNVKNAKPMLEDYEIPATFFISTGNIGLLKEFWWDDLERIVLGLGTLPEVIEWIFLGKKYKWKLTEQPTTIVNEPLKDIHHSNGVYLCGNIRQLFQFLYDFLMPMTENQKHDILAQLKSYCKINISPRPDYRSITEDELRNLGDSRYINIGAHTVTHPNLSLLSVSKQREEIYQSKTFLERILDQPIQSFSYPYGHGFYTSHTVQLVKELGFTSAVSTILSMLKPEHDIYELPRIPVEDCDNKEFERNLRAYTGN